MFRKAILLLIVSGFLTSISLPAKSEIRLNQLQVIGSHNSYKNGLDKKVAKKINEIQSNYANKLNYSHPPLTTQLEMGLRQLEIDVLADSHGGLYLNPISQQWTEAPLYITSQMMELRKPGFKVLHIPDIDVGSHCILFETCLQKLKAWSNLNPSHLPIYVSFNVKESRWKILNGIAPERFTLNRYKELEQLIVSVMGSDKLLTPNMLKEEGKGLSESIKSNGWPLVSKVRGKFIFIFDANESQLNLFEKISSPNIFANWPINHPDAAFVFFNDPDRQSLDIVNAISTGFIVRTRADEFDESKSPGKRAFEAINSGAQIISTDYYLGAMQTPVNAPFVSFNLVNKQLNTNPFVRCSLVVADENCPL